MEDSSEDQPAYKVLLMTVGDFNPSDVAKESFFSAEKLIKRVQSGQSLYPELDLRAALEKLLKVFWVLKTERVRIARKMHNVGKYLAENYQCELGFKDGFYYTDCPNMLLHKDFGYSLRGFEKYKCSICNTDPVDCDHRTGRFYHNIECLVFDGRCNICGSEFETCEHSLGEVYSNVEAAKIVTDLEVITFDLVREPEFVFSRVLEIPYSKQFILDELAADPNVSDFIYGQSIVDCKHCLTCKGYDPSATSKIFDDVDNDLLKNDL